MSSTTFSVKDLITNVVTPGLLFFVLAPGLILSIPSTQKVVVDTENDSASIPNPLKKEFFVTRHVTVISALVHALVFALLLSLVQFIILPMVLKK